MLLSPSQYNCAEHQFTKNQNCPKTAFRTLQANYRIQQIQPRELEQQVQASPYAEEHQFITHCVFHPSLCILSILTQTGKADSADGIRTTTSSVPSSGARIHTLRFSLDINFIHEQKLQHENRFKRLIVSIYSRFVLSPKLYNRVLENEQGA